MTPLRFARSALRARPAAFRVPLQRRGYAEAVNDKIKLSLVLPHQTIFRSTDVVQVNIPAESGEMGVLANHVPSIEQLKPGLVEIVEEGGASKKFFLSGGFAVVQPDSQLSINAVEGFPLEDFSAENVRAQLAEAQKIASGNGSEQDIAEAKIEIEESDPCRICRHRYGTTKYAFSIMAEELPTNSSSHGLSLMGDENHLTGYLLETPRRWHMKTTLSERQGPTSPSSIQNPSRTLDRFSDGDNYKRLLFTFPMLYSDLTSERDPFFDGRGMPLNPHNTPISRSGCQSEIGSIGKDKQDAHSPAKYDKHVTHQSSDAVTDGDNPLTSHFNGREKMWKPPKPPKPPFLANINVSTQSDVENIRPSLRAVPPKRVDDRRPMLETLYRSLPSRVPSRNFGQPFEPAVTELTPEHHPARLKHSWNTSRIVPGRYFPRPFTRRELEVLGIPLNNPSMPFPAPIPTIDKLPLRRGVISFDWKLEDHYPNDTDSFSATETNHTALPQGSWNALRQFPHKLPSLRQLTQTALYYLTPWKQSTPKQNSSLRTTITVPFAPKSETFPVEQDQLSIPGLVDGAYVLQFNLVLPLVLAHQTTRLTAAIRRCMSLRVAAIAASIVRTILVTIIQWLLFVFRVEVTVELSQV
ncbi:ATP synthase [Aspergillus similis]